MPKADFSLVAVSDLNRTVQTWDTINVVMNIERQGNTQYTEQNNNLMFDARLREKDGGVLNGQPLVTFKNLAKAAGTDLRMYRAEEGESWSDVMGRGKDFLLDITDRLMPASEARTQKQTAKAKG